MRAAEEDAILGVALIIARPPACGAPVALAVAAPDFRPRVDLSPEEIMASDGAIKTVTGDYY